MRFTLFDPTAISPHELIHVAKAAERYGFDSFSLNEGTFQMLETRGVYPYGDGQQRNWDLEMPFYEPMTLLPAIATHTERIRIFTSVLKLPLRHPLMLAKQIATAAVMSNDRFAVGVGASWAPEEYEYCGVDWDHRGRIMTESIEALRRILGGGVVDYQGEFIRFGPIVAAPAPAKPVKILVGGHHEASLRRAARLGDGWIAAGPVSLADLQRLIGRLRELRAEYEQDWSSFEIHAYPREAVTLEHYRQLEQMGVTDAGTLPINAGGELLMSETTRLRLTGQKVPAARDPAAIYAKAVPHEKIKAMRLFAERIIAHWR